MANLESGNEIVKQSADAGADGSARSSLSAEAFTAPTTTDSTKAAAAADVQVNQKFDQLTEVSLLGGAKVSHDNDGQTRKIVRANGSSIETQKFDDSTADQPATVSVSRIVEHSKDNTVKVWSQDSDGWHVTNNPAEKMKSIELEANGNTKFVGADGRVRISSGEGGQFRDVVANNVVFDDQGRISQLKYPNGGWRLVGYANDSDQITGLTSRASGKDDWQFFAKTGDDQWSKLTAATGGTIESTWNGQIRLDANGDYATRPGSNDDQAFWTGRHADGTKFLETTHNNGAVSEYDAQSHLVSSRIGNHTLRVLLNPQGFTSAIFDIDKDAGTMVTWKPEADGHTWHSDSKAFPNSRTDLTFTNDAELQYTDMQGNAHVLKVGDNANGT